MVHNGAHGPTAPVVIIPHIREEGWAAKGPGSWKEVGYTGVTPVSREPLTWLAHWKSEEKKEMRVTRKGRG